jgi:hypothetical protein
MLDHRPPRLGASLGQLGECLRVDVRSVTRAERGQVDGGELVEIVSPDAADHAISVARGRALRSAAAASPRAG